MQFLRSLVGALIGAAIGGLVWVGLGYFATAEVGYIAWGIGFLAGIGGALGAGYNAQSGVSGVASVVAALLVIAASKYMVVSLLVDKAIDENIMGDAVQISAETMIVGIADGVVGEFQAASKPVTWPPGMTIDEANSQADYPADVWAEAAKRWAEFGADEQQRLIAEQEQMREEFVASFSSGIRDEAFKDSFSPFDLLWFGLAAVTAFRLGSGSTDD